jgi:F0F1-type ATP synthase assembly protein I
LKPLPRKEIRMNSRTDDKIGKGIDVALVTLAFLGIGYLLDRWLDTKPLFTVGLVVLGLVGEFLRFWYDYDSRMKVLEAQRASATRARPAPRPAQGDRS